MATLRAARQTYKNTRSTTDAWFIRIERQDGEIIRITDADKNITMTNRVLADGTTEAIGSTVTYYSASGYRPTAAAKQAGLRAGTMDLEGILDAVTVSASGSETRQYTPSGADVVASSVHGTSDPISSIVDGATSGNAWTSDGGEDADDPAFAKFDFKQPVVFNRVRVYVGSDHRMSILRSDDGERYDELTAPELHVSAGGFIDIALPSTARTRYVQLKILHRALAIFEVEFHNDITPTETGTIARTDIENNLYDNAKVFVFLADYTDAYEDDEKIISGFLSDIELREGTYLAQFMSKLDALTFRTGRKRSPSCDAIFGSFRCGAHLRPPDWNDALYAYIKATHDIASGSWVVPTTPNGYQYFATVAGLVGASEPTWPTTPGNTVVDGAVTWKTIRAFRITDAVVTITDSRNLTVANITGDANDTWTGGTIEFTSGAIKGVKSTIKSQTGAAIELNQPLKNLPSASDTVVIVQGCRKRFTNDCITKFDNSINFQGNPYLPGARVMGKFGGQE